MITSTVPFSKLRLSDANVRKNAANAEAGLEALAASIQAHGLLQALIVSPSATKKTLFDVHAGGRRLRALTMLVQAGKLPKDAPIEVRLCENEEAAAQEISLAENLLREAMTPADECKAYQDILATGATAEDVARRFGVTVRHVHGRLRLADLAEPIFKALSEGTITLDVAMAYGAVSDHARQLAAWEQCSTTWRSGDAAAIKRVLCEESIPANHPIALFVGEDEYQAAGGRIERDLFSTDGEGTWLDAAIVQDVAARKLTFEAEIAQLDTKLAWVKPVLSTRVTYDETKDLQGYWPKYADPGEEAATRIAEIKSRLDDIAEEIELAGDEEAIDKLLDEEETLSNELETLQETEVIIPEEDRAHVGTFMVINGEGKAELAGHYYTSRKATQTSSEQSSGEDVEADPSELADAPNSLETLPRSVEEQLAKDRRDIVALHIAQDPTLALDLAIFSLARDLAGHIGYNNTGCSIKIADTFEPAGLKGIPPSIALEDLETIRTSLPNAWALESDSFASFLAFRDLSEEDRASWLSFAVSQSLKANLQSGQHQNTFQSKLGAMIGIDVAQHWRPGAERFFDRLKKSQILGVLGKIDPEMPSRYATAKKVELASAATKLCSGDTIVEPSIKERALAWIPDIMAFSTATCDDIISLESLDDESEHDVEEAEADDDSESDPGFENEDVPEADVILRQAA